MATGRQQGIRPGWAVAAGVGGFALGALVVSGTSGNGGDLDDIQGGGVAKSCQTASDDGVNRPGIPANGLAAAWQRFTTTNKTGDTPPVAYTCGDDQTMFLSKTGRLFSSKSGAVPLDQPTTGNAFVAIVPNSSGDGFYLLDQAGVVVPIGNNFRDGGGLFGGLNLPQDGEVQRPTFVLPSPLAPGLRAVNLTVSDSDDAASLTVVDGAGKESYIQMNGGAAGETIDLDKNGNRTSYSFGTSPTDAARLVKQIQAFLVAHDKTHDDESLAPADLAPVMGQLTGARPVRDVGPASLELVL